MTDLSCFFEKGELIPVIVQDASDGTVLYDTQADAAQMENHLEREEVREALETGTGSSSRGRLWTKGETSGNFLDVVEVYYDCDCDTLLVKAKPAGPACHTGNRTCFYRRLDENDCTEGSTNL